MHRLFLLLTLGTVACMDQDYQYIEWEGVDVFYQNPTDSVDILMVVDNSGSMEPYQVKLGQNFQQFLTYFIEADVDYQIATVTTDVMAETAGHIVGTIITPDTPDAETVFADNVAVGTSGSGYEMGLEAAYLALTPPLVDGVNGGFLREEAFLSIIFVSDEEDSSPLPVNDYINAFRDVKGQRARDAFAASALTVTDITTCERDAQFYSKVSVRYPDVAHQTTGVSENICAQDFEPIVTQLSLNSSRLRDTFYLSEDPDAATIQLTVNDEEWPCEDGNWSFQRVEDEMGVERSAIVFPRETMPPSNSQITARYSFGGGDPEAFCPVQD